MKTAEKIPILKINTGKVVGPYNVTRYRYVTDCFPNALAIWDKTAENS